MIHRIKRVLIVGAQRVDGAGQHRHGVRITREPVEEPLEILVQESVPLDLGGERLKLLGRREFAVDQQVAHLDEVRLLGELLDRVSAVAQDAGIPVDVGDGALGRGGVDKTLVEGGVTGLGQQRPQRDTVGALGGPDNLQVQLSTGMTRFPSGITERGVVVDCGHINPFLRIWRHAYLTGCAIRSPQDATAHPGVNLASIVPACPIGPETGVPGLPEPGKNSVGSFDPFADPARVADVGSRAAAGNRHQHRPGVKQDPDRRIPHRRTHSLGHRADHRGRRPTVGPKGEGGQTQHG